MANIPQEWQEILGDYKNLSDEDKDRYLTALNDSLLGLAVAEKEYTIGLIEFLQENDTVSEMGLEARIRAANALPIELPEDCQHCEYDGSCTFSCPNKGT